MRLIDSDALFRDRLSTFMDSDGEHYLAVSEVVKMIKLAPSVDAKPIVCAHWVEEPDRERHWHCSACHKVQGIASISMKFCPSCGASMAEHPWAASGCGQFFNPD